MVYRNVDNNLWLFRQRATWVALLLGAVLMFTVVAFTTGQAPFVAQTVAPPALDLGRLPLTFVPNIGQTDAAVHFLLNDLDGTFFFTARAVVLRLPTAKQSDPAVRLHFVGANVEPTITGGEPLPGVVNYLLGADAKQWRTNIPTYAGIVYQALYPGIDLAYDGVHGRLKGAYTVAPGADPALIRWRYSGASGAAIDEATGDLVITIDRQGATLREEAPIAWQEISGKQVAVPVRYQIAKDGTISFALGNYQRSHPLIIDPTIVYSSYLGGSAREDVEGIAVDNAGNVYLTGSTESTNFPTQGALQGSKSDEDDAFVMKINSAGNGVVYSTYLGGNRGDQGKDIALDNSGNAYVIGDTQSTNFPTQNALQNKCGALLGVCVGDIFVAKLNGAGNGLVYSTYLGGNLIEVAGGIAVDGSGHAYVTGSTSSEDYPTQNPWQAIYKGSLDAFVAKLNSSGNALVYSGYLGGDGEESGLAIAVSSGGEAYVTGLTTSNNFPTQAPLQGNNGGEGDAFVTKFNGAGSALLYSTYLGGNKSDYGRGIAVDNSGNAYFTGITESGNFPTQNPVQAKHGGNHDGFVAKLNGSGNALVYSTYLGGSGKDEGKDIAVNSAGNAYVTGETYSTNFPTVNALQGNNGGEGDGFVAKLSGNGGALDYSTYLGGNKVDWGDSIALDQNGNAFVAGVTYSANFPVQSAIQNQTGGNGDGFIIKIGTGDTPPPPATLTSTPTNTGEPPPTSTPTNTPTNTPVGQPTNTPQPEPSVTPVPGIALAGSLKYALQLIAGPGEEVTYRIRLHNSSVTEATVTVRDRLPAELTYVTGSASNGGVYDAATRTLSWSGLTVSSADDLVLTFAVTVESSLTPKVVINTAEIQPAGQDAFERSFPILLSPIPLDSDVIAPVVNRVTIGEKDVLTDRAVVLHIDATDNVGIDQMYIREWQLVTNPLPHWKVVQTSDWLPFQSSHSWTLGEESGVHYVGVWVKDSANNHSPLSRQALDFASLLLPGTTLGERGLKPYLVYYEAGQSVSATLSPATGDADLYVWYPGNFGFPDQKSTNAGTAPEKIDFTTVRAGIHLFLVHGQSAATYDLTLTPGGGPDAWPLRHIQTDQVQASAGSSPVTPGKDELTAEPVLVHSGLDPLGDATPPARSFTIYMPFVRR